MHKRKTRAGGWLGLTFVVLPGCFSIYLGGTPTPTPSPTLEPSTPTPAEVTPSLPAITATPVPSPSPTPGPTPTATPLTPMDADGDGWPLLFDCDDTQASVHPGAEDLCEDGVDADCAEGDPLCPCLPEETLIGRLDVSPMPGFPRMPKDTQDNPSYGYDSDIPLTIDASLDSICEQTVVLTSLDSCYVLISVFPDTHSGTPLPLRVEPEVCSEVPGAWEILPGDALEYRFTWDWRTITGEPVDDEAWYVIRAEWPNGQMLEAQVYLRD